jgi:glycosyltransferase involved in cell wall biosynthesis
MIIQGKYKTLEMNMDQVTLSIVVPVYNESPYNLQNLIERLAKVLVPLELSYEVIFVNDGSKEETCKSLDELCAQHDYIKLVNFSRNFGQQAAMSAGISFASGKALINMDSDLQDPPELIPDMVHLWQRGFEVVYAQRASRKDRKLKRLTAFLFYRIMAILSDTQIPRDTGEFRLIDQRVAKALQLLPERTPYLRGLIPWLGFKQTTIPINRDARQHGESTFTLRKLLMLAMDGILCFSYAPLYAVAIVGLCTITTAILIPIIWAIVSHKHLPLAAWLISSGVFLFGLQFLLLGIVSLYIARIFDQVRARPIYVVSELSGKPFSSGMENHSQSKPSKINNTARKSIQSHTPEQSSD